MPSQKEIDSSIICKGSPPGHKVKWRFVFKTMSQNCPTCSHQLEMIPEVLEAYGQTAFGACASIGRSLSEVISATEVE